MAKQIGRSELYDRVWSEPMTKVAADLGVSDVGLKKACTRHKIPTPKRGYWAKKAAGQTLTRDILPKLREEMRFLERVSFDFAPDRERSAGLREFRQSQRAERNASPRGSLKLPQFPRVDRPLPLLKATVKKLRHGKPDDGGIRAHDAGECGVHVSPATAERAIAILDALFRSLQDEGWKIEADGGATKATGQLGSLRFQLKELSRVIDHVPTPAELELEKKQRAKKSAFELHPFYYRPPWPPKDRIWTGLLKIEIIGSYLDVRRSWNDARTQTIEGLLPQIVEGFATFLFCRAEKQKEDAEKARRRAQLLKRRELATARHEREDKREELLDELTDIAVRVQRLDVWLMRTNPSPEQPELVRMLAWAKEHRAELQSLLNGNRLNELLQDRRLFPDAEHDPLYDPEGDPPDEFLRW